MPLSDYIAQNYKSQADFARAQNVARSQVQEWINNGFIVVDGKLYSPRRQIGETS